MSNNEKEIWRAHPEYEGIEVSTFGNVRSLDKVVPCRGNRTRLVKGRILKPASNGHGYLQVNVKIDGKFINKSVHRLVARTFILNPDNLLEINHKDCDKTNNSVDNLEWVTHEENIAYRDKLGHTARNNAPKSPVFAVNLSTLEVSRFPSRMEAGRSLGVFYQSINKVIKGRIKQTGGYWFKEDDDKADDAIKRKLHTLQSQALGL